MTKRTKLLSGIVAGATAAFVAGMALPATTQVPPERVTMTFFDANGDDKEKDIDVKPLKEFNAGDGAVIWTKAFDPETCEEAGSFSISFQVIRLVGKNNAWVRFGGATVLADGDINFDAVGTFTDFETGFAGAVTGGTGAYKDATGEFTVMETPEELCGKKGALITVDMLLE
jgi:hypothetical protein